jgi:hypothetical protein
MIGGVRLLLDKHEFITVTIWVRSFGYIFGRVVVVCGDARSKEAVYFGEVRVKLCENASFEQEQEDSCPRAKEHRWGACPANPGSAGSRALHERFAHRQVG